MFLPRNAPSAARNSFRHRTTHTETRSVSGLFIPVHDEIKGKRRYITMNKMIYAGWSNHIGGQDRVERESVSFSLDECRAAIVKHREKMIPSERSHCEHYIVGNKIDVLEGQGALVAYEEWELGQASRPDAEYYEDVYVDEDYRVDVKGFGSSYHLWISRNGLCIMSRLFSTDSLIYVVDEERYKDYLEEGNEDDGDIILVSEATEADVGLVSDTLDKLGITLPSSVMETIKDKIEAVYRCKSI